MSDTSSFEPSDSAQDSYDENDREEDEEDEENDEGESEEEEVANHPREQGSPSPSPSVNHEQSYTLKQEAIKELHHCLDHVVAYGNQIWQDAKRCNNWMKRMEKNPEPLGFRATPKRDWNFHIQDEVRNPKVAVHIEDAVLYSNLNHVKYVNLYNGYNLERSRTKRTPAVLFQWPVDYDDLEKREVDENACEKSNNVDQEWENYFGDGLDEIDFRRFRSRKRKFSDLGSSSSCNRLEKEGEREIQDLIQRSWDKAVHIASNVFDTNITTNVGENSSTNDKQNSEKESGSEHKEAITDRLVQAQAVLRCKELGIEFDSIYIPKNDPYYTCQVCKKRIRFHSNETIIIHLFGSVTERGCCWNRIRQEQERITQRVLENEAWNIIDNLLQVIFKSLKQRNDEQKDAAEDPMNWLDVCNSMIETLEKATNVRQLMARESDQARQMLGPQEYLMHSGGSNSVQINSTDNLGNKMQQVTQSELQTIQIDQDLLPFVMNKDIMQLVLSRLICRYDDRLSKY